MSLTYGFYNAVELESGEYDRVYDATQFSQMFDGIINDGIFASIGTAMKVTAGSALKVNIGIGRAWFNGTWTYNSAVYPISLAAAETVLDRIDAVVLEINLSSRVNSFKILKGTAASSPSRPTLTNNANVCQYALAYVYRTAGSSSVTSSDITNMVGTTATPYITSLLSSIDSTVTTNMIKDGAVTLAKMASNSVNSSKIVNGSIATVDLADGAVSTAKLADGAVTGAKMTVDSAMTEKLIPAMYSPVVSITTASIGLGGYSGKTLVTMSSSMDFAISLGAATSATLAVGTEIAVLRLLAKSVTIYFNTSESAPLRICWAGRTSFTGGVSITLPETGSTIVLKKLVTDATNGDLWLVTGAFEET